CCSKARPPRWSSVFNWSISSRTTSANSRPRPEFLFGNMNGIDGRPWWTSDKTRWKLSAREEPAKSRPAPSRLKKSLSPWRGNEFMKLILLDLLRRWGWLYLLGFVLATTFNLFAKYVGPFAVFTPYFLAPMLSPLFVVA